MSRRIVLMFHGLGGNRFTMLPIGDYCTKQLPGTQFLPIEGPIDLGSDRYPCLGWFEPPKDNARALDGPEPPQLNGLEISLARVHEAIDQLVEDGVDPRSIHLLGHSQGGAIAITAGLTYPRKLGSVCTIAGYLAITPAMTPLAVGTRFFLHHSEHDDNVGFQWADYAKSFITKIGNQCSVHDWPIKKDPHSIHNEQLDAICAAIASETD